MSASPSPLVFASSRPVSVMSAASSEVTMNGDMTVDIAGGVVTGEPELYSPQSSTGGHKKERKRRGKISAPLGGRGKFQKRKGGGGGSMSAAASAGAMAGALAASNAAFATLGYSIPTYQVSPSPSNHSLSVVPPSASTYGSSAHSSPRASPSPLSLGGNMSQTPPARPTAPRTLLSTQTRNS